MLVCSHCGSQSVVYDREYSPETGVTYRPRCLKCGREKFTNIGISKKEEPVGIYNKKCEAPGCEKNSWLKGLCHKHYIEKYGEYVPTKGGTGVKLPKADMKLTGAVFPEQATMDQSENRKDPAPLPGIRIIIPDALLQKLAIVAEREYRTVNQQAAYFVTKGLERE